MDTTDKIIQQTAKQAMDMYMYAFNNHLDITKKEDVEKILKGLNITDEKVDSAMQTLAMLDQFVQNDLKNRKRNN